MKYFIAAIILFISSITNAGVNLYTEHRIHHLLGDPHVDNDKYPTGNVPYIGQVGVEYDTTNFTYSLSFIHRSNADIGNGSDAEYSYNGISAGIKWKYCMKYC